MPALRGGPHARRTGRGLSESEEGALRYRRLQERAPPSGRGRAARLRVRLGRRAPLHRLHDVPGRAPVPHLHGRTDPARPARLDGRGAAVARSPARRRRSLDARQHLRWTPDPGPGSWRRPRRVRRLPALDGRVPRALRGIRGDAAARPGGSATRTRRAPTRWRVATSAVTTRPSSTTTTSRATTSRRPRATSTTARWPRRSRSTAPTR